MTDERAAEGIDHLQSAALEMISAARAFLDVMEEVVADREKVASVVDAVGSVAQGAMRAAARPTQPDGSDDDPLSGPVEHIRVS